MLLHKLLAAVHGLRPAWFVDPGYRQLDQIIFSMTKFGREGGQMF